MQVRCDGLIAFFYKFEDASKKVHLWGLSIRLAKEDLKVEGENVE